MKISLFSFFFNRIFILLLLFCGHIDCTENCWTNRALKIAVFSRANGKGLQADREIMKIELQRLGHRVIERNFHDYRTGGEERADVNIFFEIIDMNWLTNADHNWFAPNPEWYLQDLDCLNGMDLILCRTHESEKIFTSLGKKTFFLGFTSRDCCDATEKKDYGAFLHVAGGSPYKGTRAIVDAWDKWPCLPRVTIIRNDIPAPFGVRNVEWISYHLPMSDLRKKQNAFGIHLCPSEVEGFGHYILEAMSCGAVVITTDAPPMNEFITDKRCLVPISNSMPCNLAMRYFISSADLAETAARILSLGEEELISIGAKNRRLYLKMGEEFRKNLERLLSSETF